MADRSAIEWTDKTWNPVVGCARVSAGCEHCYAETMAARVALMQKAQGRESPYLRVVDVDRRRWNRRAVFLPERLGEPLRWRKPCRVFVNSMSDLFHEDITFEQIEQVAALMEATPQHTYQVLTKRPARMLEFLNWLGPALPNLHVGVSVENQAAADERIPLLLQCPAALRFLSVEPLLERVVFYPRWVDRRAADALQVASIGWVIVGGESGPGARPCDVSWIRSVVRQCRDAGVPVFVKQLGAMPRGVPSCFGCEGERWDADTCERCGDVVEIDVDGRRVMHLRDRKGADPSEWPNDLRVQEFPVIRNLAAVRGEEVADG